MQRDFDLSGPRARDPTSQFRPSQAPTMAAAITLGLVGNKLKGVTRRPSHPLLTSCANLHFGFPSQNPSRVQRRTDTGIRLPRLSPAPATSCCDFSVSVSSPDKGGHTARHLQGAGGRRCELEGSTWEMGSSDGAAPEPMGLSVVIRLGWPRSVRVIVVGTFKPVAWLEI